MRLHPVSFIAGLAAAWLVPALSRVVRPLAVEAAVIGMALVDEGRRVVAEQMEALEDLAAEARARREEMLLSANGHQAPEPEPDADVAVEDSGAAATGRRRSPTGGRRRAS
jgi:hypothetical protein